MFKCLVCFKEADVIFQANTFCKDHFENVWAFLNNEFGGKNINQLKKEIKEKNKNIEKEGDSN